MEKAESEKINIDFVSKVTFFSSVSGIIVLASLVLIAIKGFNYGIDFAGGAEVQVKFSETVTSEDVRTWATGAGFPNAVVQRLGEDATHPEYLIRTDAKVGKTDQETNQNLNMALEKLQSGVKTKWPNSEIRRIDTVGPQVGNQLKRNGILAMFYSLLCILIYIGIRFDYSYAPGAVVCLFHDAIVTLGIFSLLGKEINIQIMAAVLSIIGYSMNDTIVVFDRVREMSRKYKDMSLPQIINMSINNMLNRTLLTGFTTLLATLILYEFAGGTIEDFAFAMLLGIILGIYSSIYIAAPLIILTEKLRKNQTRAAAPSRAASRA